MFVKLTTLNLIVPLVYHELAENWNTLHKIPCRLLNVWDCYWHFLFYKHITTQSSFGIIHYCKLPVGCSGHNTRLWDNAKVLHAEWWTCIWLRMPELLHEVRVLGAVLAPVLDDSEFFAWMVIKHFKALLGIISQLLALKGL